MLGVVKGEGGEGGGNGGAVDEAQSFLRSKNNGFNAEEGHCFASRENLVATVVNEVNVDVGMTSNCSGDVGERRKVARR